MRNQTLFYYVVAIILLLVLVILLLRSPLVQPKVKGFADRFKAPTLTPTITLTPLPTRWATQGRVRDAITGELITGALVRSGTRTVKTDYGGVFTIEVGDDHLVYVQAEGYEPQQATSQPTLPLVIDLVPGPGKTVEHLYAYQKAGHYGVMYALLHPNAQNLFSRQSFEGYMSQRPMQPLTTTVDYVELVPSVEFLGMSYERAAVVHTTWIVREGGQEKTIRPVELLVWAGDLWRWLRGPLPWWPTLTPTLIPSPTPSATPTSVGTATSTPSLTMTPTPTGPGLPTPTPSPTPYTWIPVGSTAQVVTESLDMRAWPGSSESLVGILPQHTVVTVLEGPVFAEGHPWYRVQVQDSGLVGWCDGEGLR